MFWRAFETEHRGCFCGDEIGAIPRGSYALPPLQGEDGHQSVPFVGMIIEIGVFKLFRITRERFWCWCEVPQGVIILHRRHLLQITRRQTHLPMPGVCSRQRKHQRTGHQQSNEVTAEYYGVEQGIARHA